MFVLLLQAGSSGGAQPSMIETMSPILMMGAVFVIFYFMMIRPQQKRQKEHRKLLDALKRGDKVVTTSGIHGQVSDVEDNVVALNVGGNVVLRFDKQSIASVVEAK